MKSVALLAPQYWPDIEHMLRMVAADIIIVDDASRGGCFGPWSALSSPEKFITATVPYGGLTVPLVPSDTSGFEEMAKTGWRSEHIDQLTKWYPGRTLHLSEPYQLIAGFPRSFEQGTSECLKWLLTLLPPRKGRKTVFTAQIKGFTGNFRDLLPSGDYVSLAHVTAKDLRPRIDRAAKRQTPIVVRSGPLPPYGGNRSQESWSILDLLAREGERGTKQYLAQAFVWEPL